MSRVSVLVGACLAIGALTLFVPSAPTTDPWGWIVWGREVAHLRLDTVAGPPSWKPLPVLFTTPLSLLGAAAPAVWLVVARAGGLMAFVFAYRLGARLAGPVAGVLAAVALALSELWWRGLAHGYSEGLAVALLLWAVESHLDGHRGRALAFGSLVALSRPEAWPFALAYAVVFRPRGWPLALVVPPALWLVPDRLGSGQWFHANTAAHVNLLRAGAHPGLTVLRETWGILPPLVWACALVGAVVAVRRRDWPLAVLGAAVVVWILGLAAATEGGYPGSGRFLILPAGVACVLAGAGAVWVARPRPVLAAVLGVALVVSFLPRAARVPVSVRQSIVRARFEHDLEASVARAGGPAAVLARGRPVVPARLWWTAGALAWQLRVPLEGIHKIPEDDLATLQGLRTPAVVFAPLGGTPPDDPAWVTPRRSPPAAVLASDGTWRVLADERHTLRGCTRCQRSPASATTSSISAPASGPT